MRSRACSAPLTRVMLLALLAVAGTAKADPAVRIGPRGGMELRHVADATVGADVRLSFPMTPLTINPSFIYVFDSKITIYEVNVNALLWLPLALGPLNPYVGIGFRVTQFAYKELTPGADDDHGSRLGLNLVAGFCVDLPFASPFVEAQRAIGEFGAFGFAGGLAVALDGDPRWTGCGRRRP